MNSIFSRIDRSTTLSQLVPLVFTVVVFGAFILLLHGSLLVFNRFPSAEHIKLTPASIHCRKPGKRSLLPPTPWR